MTFYRYLEDSDVHVIDCAGRVDLEIGLERFGALERELAACPVAGEHRKLLIDFRRTLWASDEVHMQLSRLTRRVLAEIAESTPVRVAFIDNARSGPISTNEHWFLTEKAALAWLLDPAHEPSEGINKSD